MLPHFSGPLATLFEVSDGYDDFDQAYEYLSTIADIACNNHREILKDAYRLLVYGEHLKLPTFIKKSKMIRKELIYDKNILHSYERSLQ